MRSLLVLVVLLAGCGSSDDRPRSVEGVSTVASGVPCVPASPLLRAPDPAPPVALPSGAVLTDVTEQAGQRLVTGQVDATVAQVLAHFRTDPGYVVTRDEDEGRAGRLELFGARGDVSITVAVLTCPRGLTSFTVSSAALTPSAK